MKKISIRIAIGLCLGLLSSSGFAASPDSALSDEVVRLPEPFQPGDCEKEQSSSESHSSTPIANPCSLVRTGPPLELGPDLLGLGKLHPGFELPTGAVWQPALYMFGGIRTGLNVIESDDGADLTELVVRADVAFNLQLTATERIVIGFTPLHDEGLFTNYQFQPSDGEGFQDELNADIQQLWFEGDFGELFPNLQRRDDDERLEHGLDYGFSIGRQPLSFQDGMLINDTIDAVGIVRNNLQLFGASPSTRLTFLFGWNEVNRNDNDEDNDANLFGIFGETDTRRSTIEFDLVYINSQDVGDGLYAGYGTTQRFGFWNTTFRVNGSLALDEESPAVDDGVLLFAEISRAPLGTHNVIYMNAFGAIGDYTSASRGETVGGPLGRTGILFAAPGLGRFIAPLSNAGQRAVGGAVGHQWFFDHENQNLILELGVRQDFAGENSFAAGLGARFQQSIGRRWLFQTDVFLTDGDDRGTDFGMRTEFNFAF